MRLAQRVAIVGAGTGGTMVANRLARRMAKDLNSGSLEVMVFSDTSSHYYQPGFLYVALGLKEPDEIKRPVTQSFLPGVRVVFDAVTGIDVKRSMVHTAHDNFSYDYLVLATGSHPDMEALPGFSQGAYSFYTLPEAIRLRQALLQFQKGKLLMIVGVPHKCPVAPLEFMLMFEQQLRQRGYRETVQLQYTYPLGRLHSLEAMAGWAESVFAERNIESEVFFNPETIDAENRIVYTLEGEEASYDLLVGIPPHRGAPLIRQSGLGDSDGWLPTDRFTLRYKGADNVYVLGDATDLPISKAGSTAHYQSDVVVRNLMLQLSGQAPMPLYDGKVFCFVEGGLTQATHITFDYHHPPVPSSPTEMVHWFKEAFNQLYWSSLRGLI